MNCGPTICCIRIHMHAVMAFRGYESIDIENPRKA